MSDDKARIKASLDGANQVVSDANRMADALENVGDKADQGQKKSQHALKGLTKALTKAAESSLEMVSSFVSMGASLVGVDLNLRNAMEQAKLFDGMTARLAQTAKVSGKDLQNSFQGLETRLLTSAPELAQFTKALGQMTYDPKGSIEAIEGLGTEALATGKTLQEELDLGVMLRDGLGVVGDTTEELGRLRAMAEQVSTVGGHLAFKDTLQSLAPLLGMVNTATDESRHKLEALMAVLGKGLQPQDATMVGASALATLKSRALDIERVTGKRVLDDQGQLINPLGNLKDIKALAERRYGKNKEAMRRALIHDFGDRLGLAIYRTDFNEVDTVAQAKNEGKTKQEADTFRNTDEGQRTQFRLEQERNLRKVGAKLLGAGDRLMSSSKVVPASFDVHKMLSLQEKLNRRRNNQEGHFFDGSGFSSEESLEADLRELQEKYTKPITTTDPIERQEEEDKRSVFFSLLQKQKDRAEGNLKRRKEGKENWLEQHNVGANDIKYTEEAVEAYQQIQERLTPSSSSAPMSPEGQKAFQQLMKHAGEWMAQSFKDYLRSGEVIIKTFDPNAQQGNPG